MDIQKSGGTATDARPNQPEGVEPYIDKQAVKIRLGVSLRTVDDWMKRGLLPYYKLGHSVIFKWSEVEAHLAQTCRVCRRSRTSMVPAPANANK